MVIKSLWTLSEFYLDVVIVKKNSNEKDRKRKKKKEKVRLLRKEMGFGAVRSYRLKR